MRLTEIVVWIFLAICVVNMMKRQAFISLTVAMLALYMIHNTHHISRQTFRGFVLLIAVSWLYDAVSIFIIEPSSADEDLEDGGQEWKIRRFTKLTTLILFLWKMIVALVFWKDSLDFSKIVRNKKTNEEDDFNNILAHYQNQYV